MGKQEALPSEGRCLLDGITTEMVMVELGYKQIDCKKVVF